MDLINKILRFKVRLLGLSTDDKPLDVVNGSTFLEVDTSKFYIMYEGEWYEQNAEPTEPEEPTENSEQK